MHPYLRLPRALSQGRRLLRLPALAGAAQASALLAAVFVGAAVFAGAWRAAGVGAAALVAAGFTAVRLRAHDRGFREALRARADWERRYCRLYDNVAVAVFRAGPQGRLSGANHGLCTLLGYRSEAELLAADFAEHAYIGPATFEAVLQRARTQGTLENLEMRLRRFDGLTITVLATIEAIWDEAGEVVAFEGTAVDVTRERLADSQRRSMERRFRRLFDVSAVGMLVGNLRRGALEEANPALIELLGLRPSELPAPFAKVIPEDQRPMHRSMRAALEAHGSAGPLATEYLRADGARVAVLLSAAMVEPQYGEFVGVVVGLTPQMTAALQEGPLQKSRQPPLAELPTAAATFDGEGRLKYCNHGFCELLGLAGEPSGSGLADLLGGGCRAELSDAVARAVGGETACLGVECEAGGTRRRLDVILLPHCRGDATPAGYLAVIQDRSGSVAPATRTPAAESAAGPGGTDCLGGRRTA